MTSRLSIMAATALFGISVALMPNAALAMPIDAFAVKNAAKTDIEIVRWRGGWGAGAGFVAGAIVGGALAAPYYYGPGPYYGYYPRRYYGYGPYYRVPDYAGPAYGDGVAYCIQRFRSYDVRTRSYVGYDGLRHSCP